MSGAGAADVPRLAGRPVPRVGGVVAGPVQGGARPAWGRPFLVVSGCLVVLGVLVAASGMAVPDSTVWLEAAVVAGSTGLLVVVAWWSTGRDGGADQRIVLTWGLGSGAVLGLLWVAEIAFNNLTPHTISTASARGLLDDATWVVVGVVTIAVAARVAMRTGRWRTGVRTGVWSGTASGLGAAVGGALLLALLRPSVERDPLMLAEWQEQGSGVDLTAYVTRETMAGVWGHLWVLGIAQGAVLGAIATGLAAAVGRRERAR
jgi:hypothetical protein